VRNLKIMKNRPSISDEELTRLMNFNQVLAGYQVHHLKVARWWRFGIGTALITGVALIAYLTLQPAPPVDASRQPEPALPNPKPVPALPPSDSVRTQPATKTPARAQQPPTQKSTPVTPPPAIVEEVTAAYTPAHPVQGFENLYDYFRRELRYPDAVLADSMEGIVTVSFFISKQGQPEQVQVEQSLGPLFDAEALRLVRNMPAWEPARIGETPTLSKLALPITFRIEK
jgi:TonB family protein